MAFDRQISALTIFCEASSASQYERICVAHTILNRVHSGRFQPTAAGVCLKRYQYSEWNADAADNANLERGANTPDNDPVMIACGQAYDLASQQGDPTHNATHYHDKSIAPPSWTIGAEMTLETDKFFFYSNVR